MAITGASVLHIQKAVDMQQYACDPACAFVYGVSNVSLVTFKEYKLLS